MIPFILLAIGFLLIFFEFYLPGGVMGAAGVVIVIISIVVFTTQYDSMIGTILFIGTAIAGLAVLFRFALWRIKSAKPEKSVYSDDAQEGFRAHKYNDELIGQEGIVATELRPGGYIKIGHKRHSAISKSGYIEVGAVVDIISGEGESLIVTFKKKDQEK